MRRYQSRTPQAAFGGGKVSGVIDMNGNRIHDSTGPLNLGTAASTNHSLVAGSTICGGPLEVDGVLYPDAGIFFPDNAKMNFGNSSDCKMYYSTDPAPDALLLGLSTESRTLYICETADLGTAFTLAQQDNPTVCIQSADATNQTQRLCLAHNQTHGLITAGNGGLAFQPDEDNGNGGLLVIREATTELTGVTGASVTATNLIPDGAIPLGVATRITTTLGATGGTTGYQVGDGADADRWGDITGVAAGTTSDNTDWTATTLQAFIAANNVVLTAVGGNFDGTGAIRISVHYFINSAPTA